MARKLTYSKAINEALHQEMERDEDVFILGEDVAKMGGDFGVTQGIWDKWPERAKDTPLSEAAILGLSAGAAVCGLRPVPEIMFADFLSVGFDQMVNNAAKLNFMYQGEASASMVVRAPTGAGLSTAYHHSQSVEPWFMNVPGLVIAAPASPYEAKGLLIGAIRNDNPVIFLEHKLLYTRKGEVPEEPYEIGLYEAEIEREGTDITVVASMKMLDLAHEAAEVMEKEGVSLEIIDPRTLYPLDKRTIKESVAKTGRLVIVQEGPKFMGAAAEISAFINEELFEYLECPIKRVTSLDAQVAFAPEMEDYILPKSSHVADACREAMDF
jgi:pyruvate dehydrogenase E1 component beta subunit